ncbi:MAG: putative rRNA maturation factor [Blastocatellia bacterium]|jgi:probable rRNA maturation factor|nr:putative rRNA maturation factor [Blastocatellia bacterium]
MIEVVNRQRKVRIDCARWQTFTAEALELVPAKAAGVTVAFVSDRTISELNRMWRHKSGATDVLSFPTEPEPFEEEGGANLGDVVISVERAAVQAKENGLAFEAELAQLILHGLLHLSGYDHETDKGEMNRLELRLRRRLRIGR